MFTWPYGKLFGARRPAGAPQARSSFCPVHGRHWLSPSARHGWHRSSRRPCGYSQRASEGIGGRAEITSPRQEGFPHPRFQMPVFSAATMPDPSASPRWSWWLRGGHAVLQLITPETAILDSGVPTQSCEPPPPSPPSLPASHCTARRRRSPSTSLAAGHRCPCKVWQSFSSILPPVSPSFPLPPIPSFLSFSSPSSIIAVDADAN